MNILIGSDSINSISSAYLSKTSQNGKLENTLKNSASATDEELMEACKSFESYLVEQVFKGMEKTVQKSDEEQENQYMAQFGDMLYEEYAKAATESEGFGIAQMLYDSMKRNT